jgi:branched-chain amino acid transport system ATP-binding protein
MLEIEGLSIRFGGLQAVMDFNLTMEPGELLGLIGPNGAGKTTVFNMLTGLYHPNSGRITFRGRSLRGLKPNRITRLGIARTFQNIRLFGNLSVLDNVRVAYHLRSRVGMLASVLRTPGFSRQEREFLGEARRLLGVLGLEGRALELAKNLPYGEQRRVEIARALATGAPLILLDEPAAGMNPQETAELMNTIRRLNTEFEKTILLIEHHMEVVMGVCRRIVVLDYGQTIACGTPEEIRRDRRVIEAYLGEEVA